MTNSLITIAKTLAERVNDNQPTAMSDMHIEVNGKKQLNYEIMFQLLQGEVEKHILENQGNEVVDEFKQKILDKFSSLIQPQITSPITCKSPAYRRLTRVSKQKTTRYCILIAFIPLDFEGDGVYKA
jgi:hypothetical protein